MRSPIDDEAAVVRLPRKKGHGVLVPGNLIITAAHCVDYSCTGEMVLGCRSYTEEIETQHGRIKVTPWTVEPVRDVAVLGALDDQDCPELAEALEGYCEKTKPVPLCLRKYKPFKRFPVHIRDHRSGWVTGCAMLCQEGSPNLAVEADAGIKGGASGGPVVNEAGELVGIVSTFGGTAGKPTKNGSAPRPHLALPVWVLRIILGWEGAV